MSDSELQMGSPPGHSGAGEGGGTLGTVDSGFHDCDQPETASDIDESELRRELLNDKWRLLFDRYDPEGFGEIPWEDFLEVLKNPDFIAAVDVNKREILAEKAQEGRTSAITFQEFVNVMTGKRSRSFKCAVHHRDREVYSENDFHILVQEPPLFRRMVRLIADEFLTEERDRKYHADHYTCCPPPLFILIITLIEVQNLPWICQIHGTDVNRWRWLFSLPGRTRYPRMMRFGNCIKKLGFFTYYTVAMGEVNPSGPVPIDSVFIYRPDKRLELWRFIFYMVLHAGWLHLIFNLLVQVLVGLPLEMVHGSLRIGAVYMAGVLAGSLGTSVFDTDVYLVGASGGVYALLAAHLANVLLNYSNMEFGIVRLVGIFIVASADVGFAIYDRYAAEQVGPPVSYVAHLTGALAGLTIGLLVLKNFEQKLHGQLMWWVALGVYAACTIFAILFNVFNPGPPPFP